MLFIGLCRYLLDKLYCADGDLVNQFRTACWMTAYVLSNPKYKALIMEEIKAILDESPADPAEPITERLSRVPLEVWETRMPVFDSCIRETIRLTLHGITARMNIGDKAIVLPSGKSGQGRFQKNVAPT